ncbi:hypothetical protein [Brevibacillus fulvus]|uniref:Uncharacterized protein n=1 Tax=Brevibacillus fulvus TaxID=1125967 RepID=A0A939BTX3_9BACL|nr:hypothetical protein [Brevibacillus fulvus]MBM7588916.1 hypothetical protein [Brevibacillus fulvus]
MACHFCIFRELGIFGYCQTRQLAVSLLLTIIGFLLRENLALILPATATDRQV